MSTLTPLGAELTAIRERSERPVPAVTALPFTNPAVRALMESAADVPRLAAAVEFTLAAHQPGRFVVAGQVCRDHRTHRDFAITGPEAQAVRDCPSCTANVYLQCAGCQQPHPCRTVTGITAELVGEKPDVS